MPRVEELPEVKVDLPEKLAQSLAANDSFFPRRFTEVEIYLFCRYFQLVLKWNDLLHLTTITAPEDFAKHHLFEAAFALQNIHPTIQKIWDIGSGVGIPGVPFAILRPDLSVNLIESNKKKAIFLKEVKFELGIHNLQIINERFEKIQPAGPTDCITSRALDGLSALLPAIFEFGQDSAQFLFFGTDSLLAAIHPHIPAHWHVSPLIIPQSHHRLTISLSRST